MDLQAKPRRRSTHLQLRGVVRRGVALRGWIETSQSGVSNECPPGVQTPKQLGLSDGRGLMSVQQVSCECPSSVLQGTILAKTEQVV